MKRRVLKRLYRECADLYGDDRSGPMRRVTPHDRPATWESKAVKWPVQVVFQRDADGRLVATDDNEAAITVAWFGWTTEPLPAALRGENE